MTLDWSQAACRGLPAEWWNPAVDVERRQPSTAVVEAVERAKAICVGCSIRQVCLEWALRQNEWIGIWGGLGPGERRKLKARLTAVPLVAGPPSNPMPRPVRSSPN
jgi:WhiB family redox-sensing transcriptional regulator